MTIARQPDHPVEALFVNRWSPRAYTGETIPDPVLQQAFEAARWAPSAKNVQPWRFILARRDTPAWGPVFDLLNPRNRLWADKASALIALLSKTTDNDGAPLITHSFDTGAAWANFAHQLVLSGWHSRAIGGFDRARAPQVLAVPDDFRVEILIAVGRQGDADDLAEEFRSQETPNARHPQKHFVFEGAYSAP